MITKTVKGCSSCLFSYTEEIGWTPYCTQLQRRLEKENRKRGIFPEDCPLPLVVKFERVTSNKEE